MSRRSAAAGPAQVAAAAVTGWPHAARAPGFVTASAASFLVTTAGWLGIAATASRPARR